ncbi:Protein FAM210A [Frankliniella fusca]|uniref:Protein FAM210A n=1 Tax=Frankliniella fusca TaxID=407009 RepID=A0AAE1HD76_9NEOP|nr:Protein FAM210A [Frankliniella fusca]
MASSRLIHLMRPTFHPDVFMMRCKRVLSSVPSCSSLYFDRRSCGSFHSGRILPLISENQSLGAFSQFYRNYASNLKDKQSSDPASLSSKSDASKPPSPNLDSPETKSAEDADEIEQFQKLSLYQRLKAMYRDYWYVIVPVHVSTSIVWFGCFYYAASSGIDIIAILESLHFSERVISIMSNSGAGYVAVAYALYKIFTPLRYTVTIGGTTFAIKFLKHRGLIKPRRPIKEAKEKMQEKLSAMKLKREKEKER